LHNYASLAMLLKKKSILYFYGIIPKTANNKYINIYIILLIYYFTALTSV